MISACISGRVILTRSIYFLASNFAIAVQPSSHLGALQSQNSGKSAAWGEERGWRRCILHSPIAMISACISGRVILATSIYFLASNFALGIQPSSHLGALPSWNSGKSAAWGEEGGCRRCVLYSPIAMIFAWISGGVFLTTSIYFLASNFAIAVQPSSHLGALPSRNSGKSTAWGEKRGCRRCIIYSPIAMELREWPCCVEVVIS